jgi:predicted DNA-binding transcriptional regulator AlpA
VNKSTNDLEPEIRLLSKAEVCDRVSASFPTIWAWMREGKFPRARSLVGRPVWLESDIVAFCSGLPERPYLGDAGYSPPPGTTHAKRFKGKRAAAREKVA